MNVLGKGGMATVYLAHDDKFNARVAVKVLNRELVFNENIRKRFLSEARNMFRMSHSNIVRVSDLIDDGERVAFVMDFIEGETLKEYLERRGRLSDDETKRIFSQMLDAVGYVHDQNLVHRDIKLSNFMLDNQGTVKLMDFGIAKNTDAETHEYTQTGTGMQMGTPMYMSPEQITETRSVTHLSDIYSLGVMLWQMVSGRKPYDGSTLSDYQLKNKIVNEALPLLNNNWDSLIQRATSKEVTSRYPDCRVWKNELHQQSPPGATANTYGGGNPTVISTNNGEGYSGATGGARHSQASGLPSAGINDNQTDDVSVVKNTDRPPKTWLLESILTTLFCCLPFGIAGIVNASKVESRYYSGDIDGAYRASVAAKKWSLIGLIMGLIVIAAYFTTIAILDKNIFGGDSENYNDFWVGNMVLVEGGTFAMGCTREQSDCGANELPVHEVTLDDYYIAETEVTQSQWKAVMGYNPSKNEVCDECPVESVSWDDIQIFLAKLNSLTEEGLYRLPTEAEWEYAARGGRKSGGFLYAGSNIPDEVAWIYNNSGTEYLFGEWDESKVWANQCSTHSVRSAKSNELGLYDMSGNVFEWCSDWFGSYAAISRMNPKGPSTGIGRVCRGGSWYNDPSYSRTAYRLYRKQDVRLGDIGFRLARTP